MEAVGQRAQRAPSPPRTTVAAAATVDAVVVMATAVVSTVAMMKVMTPRAHCLSGCRMA